MKLKLEEIEEGVMLPLQVTPKAKNNSIMGIHQGRLKISVTQAPEKGKANKAVIQFLAKKLGIRKSQFSLVSGSTSQKKMILISNLTCSELNDCIESALKP